MAKRTWRKKPLQKKLVDTKSRGRYYDIHFQLESS
jgi:hypothetical protein